MSGRTSTRKKTNTNKGSSYKASRSAAASHSRKAAAARNRKKAEQPAFNALLNAFAGFGIKPKNVKRKNGNNNAMGHKS